MYVPFRLKPSPVLHFVIAQRSGHLSRVFSQLRVVYLLKVGRKIWRFWYNERRRYFGGIGVGFPFLPTNKYNVGT